MALAADAGDEQGALLRGLPLRETSIAELGRRALTGARIEALMRQAADDSARLLRTDRSAVLLAHGAELRCEAACGWPESEIRPVPLGGDSHLAHICLSREPAVVVDFATDPRFVDSRHLSGLGLVSSAAVPIRGGRDRVLGVLAVHSATRRRFGEDAIVYLRSLANVLAAAVGREHAEAVSRRTQAQLRFLAEASGQLAGSLDYQETLRRLAELAVPGLADRCAIELQLEGDRRTVVTAPAGAVTASWAESLAGRHPSLGSGTVPSAGVILAASAAGESELPGRPGSAAQMIVPLRVGERELGVVTFARSQGYDADDLLFAGELVRRGAIAVDNAMLHRAAVRASDQIRRTQRATAELAEATTPHEIAEAIVSSGAASVGASAGWVAELSADGDSLELLASLGYEEPRVREYSSIPLGDSNPTTDALARREPLYFRSADEVRATYPELPYTRFEAMAVVPVAVGDAASGILALNFSDEHAFDQEERLLLDSLAKLYAQSLERAKLYEASRQGERAAFVLARLAEALERATSVARRARRATALLVEEVADFAAIDLLDQERRLERLSAAGRDQDWWGESSRGVAELARRAVITGKVQAAKSDAADGSSAAVLRVLPMRARGHAIGTLALGVRAARGGRGLDDPAWLAEVAGRVALALDNAKLYEREHSASQTLQLGLLGGRLPDLPDMELEGAYRPGTVANDVGGDWYDAFLLPQGSLAVVVGDVVGHDLRAALAMGQLRAAVRALAPLGDPVELLQRLDAFVESLDTADMATVAYVEIDSSRRRLRYACAGHPPPLVLAADGDPRWLSGGRSAPLGSGLSVPPPVAEASLAVGETIVLYTDGLVERKGESLEVGLERLLDAVRDAHTDPLPSLRERILTALLANGPQEDDVCLVLSRPCRPYDAPDRSPAG